MPPAKSFGVIVEPRVAASAPHGLAWLRDRLLGISPEEASFARRGFAPTEASRQQRLEQLGRTFVGGYNTAIRTADPASIGSYLDAAPHDLRGFAFEGAGMGFALLDILAPWPRRSFQRFLAGPAASHRYMAHVGAGWALARTSPRLAWRLGPLDPLLRWLMFDGFGFHVGYFDPHCSVDRQRRPGSLRNYALNVFDQGLGRALWFVSGAMAARVRTTIHAFLPDRHADLWSGIGLATAYAGGASAEERRRTASAAGNNRTHIAQGESFAAKARALASKAAS